MAKKTTITGEKTTDLSHDSTNKNEFTVIEILLKVAQTTHKPMYLNHTIRFLC
jgi:hypothetical protein